MLVIIPARGGSVGIPRKNIKLLKGKPLIQYTIDAARLIFKDEDILVSTDDEEIKKLVENMGLKVPFLRPSDLAGEKSGMREVLLHSLEFMETKSREYESILLLQPTSPFRTSQHILEALKIFENNKDVDMVASVKKTKANPYTILKEENSEGFLETSKTGAFIRRQDSPKVWELNGAIFVINSESLKNSQIYKFKKVKKYVMDQISSHDLDDMFDWKLAEIFVEKGFVQAKTGNKEM